MIRTISILNAIKEGAFRELAPYLKEFEPLPGSIHNILFYKGNFCIVVPLQFEEHKIALRIFIKRNLTHYYIETLSAYLCSNKNEYLLPFSFFDKKLPVNEKGKIEYLDCIIMDWVEGDTLKTYIRKIIFDQTMNDIQKKSNLHILANSFLRMFRFMHSMKISHGDLHHGNVKIHDGNIVLIDYDSLYIPILNQKILQTTCGIPHYQHPNRELCKYLNEKNDYFSELVIYLTIIAFAEKLDLWTIYRIDDTDYDFLFNVQDYIDYLHSSKLETIASLSPQCRQLIEALKKYLSIFDIASLNPFDVELGSGFSIIRALYCINCGTKFDLMDEHFCINCGYSRRKIM